MLLLVGLRRTVFGIRVKVRGMAVSGNGVMRGATPTAGVGNRDRLHLRGGTYERRVPFPVVHAAHAPPQALQRAVDLPTTRPDELQAKEDAAKLLRSLK